MTLFFFWGKVGRISFCSSESLHLEILLPWHLPLCPSVGSLGVRFSMAPNTVLCIKQSNFSNFFIFGGIQFIIALSVFPRIPFCVLSGLLLLAQHCGQLKPYFEILDHCALCEHIFTIACFFFPQVIAKCLKLLQCIVFLWLSQDLSTNFPWLPKHFQHPN